MQTNINNILLYVFAVVIVGSTTVASASLLHVEGNRTFPLYKQCNPEWGDINMNGSTICQEGCAMSCVSMGIASADILVDGKENVNPETLNAWLKTHNGYRCLPLPSGNMDCNNLVMNAPEKISPRIKYVGEKEKPPALALKKDVEDENSGLVCIGHVRNNHHFVLLTGANDNASTFFVNDPGFDVGSYEYADISDVIMYHIAVK